MVDTHQVFDEIPEANTILNQAQIVPSHPVDLTELKATDHDAYKYEDGNSQKSIVDVHEKPLGYISTSQILSTKALLSIADKLFAEMPDPVIIFSEALMSTNEDEELLGLISGWKAHMNYKEVRSWSKYRSYSHFALVCQTKEVSYFTEDITKQPTLKLCALAKRVDWRDPGFIHTSSLKEPWRNFMYTYRLGQWLLFNGAYVWSRMYEFKSFPYPVQESLQKVFSLKLRKYSDLLTSNHSTCYIYMILVNGKYVRVVECDAHPNTAWIYVSFDPGILESGMLKLLLTTTLEDKCVFRCEEETSEEYKSEWFNPQKIWCHIRLVNGFLFWSIFFLYYNFNVGETRMEFTWHHDIVAESLILFKLRIMKPWEVGSMTSNVITLELDNLEYM